MSVERGPKPDRELPLTAGGLAMGNPVTMAPYVLHRVNNWDAMCDELEDLRGWPQRHAEAAREVEHWVKVSNSFKDQCNTLIAEREHLHAKLMALAEEWRDIEDCVNELREAIGVTEK